MFCPLLAFQTTNKQQSTTTTTKSSLRNALFIYLLINKHCVLHFLVHICIIKTREVDLSLRLATRTAGEESTEITIQQSIKQSFNQS